VPLETPSTIRNAGKHEKEEKAIVPMSQQSLKQKRITEVGITKQ